MRRAAAAAAQDAVYLGFGQDERPGTARQKRKLSIR
jgi:hypothetical protein